MQLNDIDVQSHGWAKSMLLEFFDKPIHYQNPQIQYKS